MIVDADGILAPVVVVDLAVAHRRPAYHQAHRQARYRRYRRRVAAQAFHQCQAVRWIVAHLWVLESPQVVAAQYGSRQ